MADIRVSKNIDTRHLRHSSRQNFWYRPKSNAQNEMVKLVKFNKE
jgi:hypothetical protein